MMSLEARLARVSVQTAALDRKISTDLVTQKRKLAGLVKNTPERPTGDSIAHPRFLHSSSQFPIPVQNWKDGTPFYRTRPQRKTTKNIHSSGANRSRRILLEDDEIECILESSHQTAALEVPLRGVFEIVPTYRGPIELSHKCIWKEHM
jgi:hypothetical protein